MIPREHAARLGRETLNILAQGRYQTPSGQSVYIKHAVERAVANTESYPPDTELSWMHPGPHDMRIEVRNESTLEAALRLLSRNYARVAALNFASAKNPGGGFTRGARAQEESLARSSGLYACLKDHPMYEHHRRQNDPLYTSWALYSPDVPVFRNDAGARLETFWSCSFITCAAVNVKAMGKKRRVPKADIRQAMERRIRRVLAIAAMHEHDALVLGAWGCGAFRNDAQMMAELFEEALHDFDGAFEAVVFAILDTSREQRFKGPFNRLAR